MNEDRVTMNRQRRNAIFGAIAGAALTAVITAAIHSDDEWFFMLVGWWVMAFGLIGAGCQIGWAFGKPKA